MTRSVIRDAPTLPQLQQIRMVMVNTTLAANIGAAARAMKTMGITQLVLVDPKFFPHGDATALASGAADVLSTARVVATLEDAIADCELVFGTSARSRTIPWPLLDVRQASALAIREAAQNHAKIAIVFGREDRGLTNEELALCQYHLTIPVNPEYGVLNVAAAIQVVCYELRMQALTQAQSQPDNPLSDATTSADHAQIDTEQAATAINMPLIAEMVWDEPLIDQSAQQQFYQHFEQTLIDIDFLDPNNPRLLPLRIRRLFSRIRLDRVEYNLLRGFFSRVQAMRRGEWPPASLQAKQSPADQQPPSDLS